MSILRLKNVFKKYVLSGAKHNPYASLKEQVSESAVRAVRKLMRLPVPHRPRHEEFWALQDIDLEIEEGDRVALLGRNGAGKSTLLKLISRITQPTKGSITIRGRLSSLLEVGTGFHPDLTGRENILFNGAIMGMSYKEMKKKFDEIVAFADIEKFLDTPIKRYSSGMFMRLGFAIAAHLDSDLLIVDEVLAVGDAQFQKKCLSKMNEISTQGSTILFVSHSTNAVLSLCNKGIFLEGGRLKAFEPIEKCIGRYLRSCPAAGLSWKGSAGDEHILISEVKLESPSGDAGFYYQGDETNLHIDCTVLQSHEDLFLGFSILNAHNRPIAHSRLSDHREYVDCIMQPGRHRLSFHLDLSLFHPGEYQIRLDCSIRNKKIILQDEIFLKFAVYSPIPHTKSEPGTDKDGISLGNRWKSFSYPSIDAPDA